jgi:hypothetical protein
MRCPHCGAAVPRRARACPECGSDDRTGWAPEDEIDYQAVDLPDEYDPGDWQEQEEGRKAARGGRLVVVMLIVLGLLGVLGAVATRLAQK